MVKYSLGHEVSNEHGCSTMEKQPLGAQCFTMRHVGSWLLSGLCVPGGFVALQRSPSGVSFPPYLNVLLVTFIHVCCSPVPETRL